MNDNLQTVVDLLGAHCKRLESEIERLTQENARLRKELKIEKDTKSAIDFNKIAKTTTWPEPYRAVLGQMK